VFVAEDTDGSVIGFVSVGSRLHWSGETDAYVGELVVAECASSLVTCAASVLVAIQVSFATSSGRRSARDVGSEHYLDRAVFALRPRVVRSAIVVAT
jgi:hypothetical protein